MNQTFGPDQTDPSNAIFMPRIPGPHVDDCLDLLRCQRGASARTARTNCSRFLPEHQRSMFPSCCCCCSSRASAPGSIGAMSVTPLVLNLAACCSPGSRLAPPRRSPALGRDWRRLAGHARAACPDAQRAVASAPGRWGLSLRIRMENADRDAWSEAAWRVRSLQASQRPAARTVNRCGKRASCCCRRRRAFQGAPPGGRTHGRAGEGESPSSYSCRAAPLRRDRDQRPAFCAAEHAWASSNARGSRCRSTPVGPRASIRGDRAWLRSRPRGSRGPPSGLHGARGWRSWCRRCCWRARQRPQSALRSR
jgi:hypothetical protein